MEDEYNFGVDLAWYCPDCDRHYKIISYGFMEFIPLFCPKCGNTELKLEQVSLF